VGGHISYNNFDYHKGGFKLSSNSTVKANNNNLRCLDNEVTFGISAVNGYVTPSGSSPNRVYTLTNNNIEVRSGGDPASPAFGAGIYLGSTRNALVRGNNIKLRIYELVGTGNNEKPVIHGVYAVNSPDNVICSNNIDGETPFQSGVQGYGRGISLLNAPNNAVSCNTIDAVRYGMEFRMNCNTPDGVQGNNLLRLNRGILAAENPNTATPLILGPQEYMGNLWIEGAGNYDEGATYDGSQFNANLEKFTVDNSQTISFTDPDNNANYTMTAYPTFSPMGWFFAPFPPEQDNYACTEPCQDRRSTGGEGGQLEKDGRYRNIATSQDSMTDMSDMYQWLLRSTIYGDLKTGYGTQIPQEFTGFYNAQLNTTAQHACELNDAIARIGAGNGEAVGRLYELDSLAYDSYLNSDSIPTWLQTERDSLAEVISQLTSSDIAATIIQNTSYPTTAEYETMDKTINEIWLSDFAGRDSVLTDHQSNIEQIADLCPETHGHGVFKARSMYIMITGLAKADWGICDEVAAQGYRGFHLLA
jgi:hypothetical protein